MLQYWTSSNGPDLKLDLLTLPRSLVALSVGILLLLSWRLWRFSVIPRLHPREPLEYPYWIPCHLVSFLRNSEALFASAINYFHRETGVYAITLAGQKVYVVTDPRLVGHVFKDTTNLSFDGFLHDTMIEFGTSEAGIRAILKTPTLEGKHGGHGKSVSQIAHDLQVGQTHGDALHELGKHMIEVFDEKLSLCSISTHDAAPRGNGDQKSSCVISLKAWTANCFIEAGQRSYFGDMLATIDPALPSALVEMDNLSWQIFYRCPKICRLRLNQLCEQILSALRKYLEIPIAARPCPAWFTPGLEQQYRRVGLSNKDIATQLLFLYWGINTNISKVGFWIIAHLLMHPELVDEVRREIAPAMNADGTIDSLRILNACPVLDAIWLETLRLSAASVAIRQITHDFVLGDKLLRAGNQVLVSARQLHLRPHEFGLDVLHFDHQRFLLNPALARSPAFRPFGGGPTMCPGRLLAKHMTLHFIAMLYHRFEVAVEGAQKFPHYEEGKPSIGIMSGEGDLRVLLSVREMA